MAEIILEMAGAKEIGTVLVVPTTKFLSEYGYKYRYSDRGKYEAKLPER